MHTTFVTLLLRLSYLHLVSYALVALILFVAVADIYVIRTLRKLLRRESGRLSEETSESRELAEMIHPIARAFTRPGGGESLLDRDSMRREVELAEAALFVPLRSRLALTRDLSTLMGLIATLLALVAAAADFAKHGQPERLIGSVGTGCLATCVAAIGCAIALWNLSKLTRLRLEVACESERLLRDLGERANFAAEGEVPIQHASGPQCAA